MTVSEQQNPPRKSRDVLPRGKKIAIISVIAALLLAGGAGTAFAVAENNRTKAYDEQVQKAQELIADIERASEELPQAQFVFVEANSLIEKRHFSDMKKIGNANEKLVAKKTLEPVTEVVKELTDVYGEDTKEPVVSEADLEHHTQWDDTFVEEGTLEALLDLQDPVTTVAPPAASGDLEDRLSDEQISEADDAVVANTELLEELQTELERYTSALHDMDDLVVAHAELLVEPATEAVEHAESYAKGWDKASNKSKKKLKTATSHLEESLDAFVSGEQPTDEDSSGDSDVVEVELSTIDAFTFVHESADESALELATNLRSTFVKFLIANANVKKSHDEAVKKAKVKAEVEAAAAATAQAGAATYQDPQTGMWEQTPGYTGGGAADGGGGSWNPPSSSGGGGGGGGSTNPPASGGGGGSSGGGGGYTCPGQPAGTIWQGGTVTTDGVTCKVYVPNVVPDDW